MPGLLREKGMLTDERQQALAGMVASAARALLRSGLDDQAEEHWRVARDIHPSGGLSQAYGSTAMLMLQLVG
ncbi:MAG: hypothetical protein R3B91_12680 [Planctomycetaceae bacterium]